MCWPLPSADQRVARLPSRVLAATLPSSALATTDATGRAVTLADASAAGVKIERTRESARPRPSARASRCEDTAEDIRSELLRQLGDLRGDPWLCDPASRRVCLFGMWSTGRRP